MEQHPFAVVFVCTGNRFRSALAEAVFRAERSGPGLAVESFGTLDLGRVPPLGEAIEEARRLGVDVSAHMSRPLSGADLSSADLVLGFEQKHVAAAVVEAHAPRERTFVLSEAVDLLEAIASDGGPRDTVARASAARRQGRARVRELADPLGRPAAAQRAIADEVHDLTRRLAAALFPGR